MTDQLARTTPPQAPEKFRGWLDQIERRIADVLPSHIKPETMVRVFGSEMARNTDLRQCTQQSLISSIMLCSQLGLEPAAPLGLAYLIPRRNKHNGGRFECNVQIGYKGLIALAQRSGRITRISANVVYAKEAESGAFHFSWEPPEIKHAWSPFNTGADGDIIAAYCIAETDDGGKYVSLLNRREIDARRARGGNRSFSPWDTDFAAMARKSAIRALLSGGTVPISTELSQALSVDAGAQRPTESDRAAAPELVGGRHGAFAAAAEQGDPIDVEATVETLAPAPQTPPDATQPLASGFTDQTPPPVEQTPAGDAEKAAELFAVEVETSTAVAIGLINEIAGTRAKKTARANVALVEALLRAGHTHQDIQDVITDLGARWKSEGHTDGFTPDAVLAADVFAARLERARSDEEAPQDEPPAADVDAQGEDPPPQTTDGNSPYKQVHQAAKGLGIEWADVEKAAKYLGMSRDPREWSEKGARALISTLEVL